MKTCTVDGCDRPLRAKGLCATHWVRQHKYGSTNGFAPRKPVEERFWEKVRKTDTCWIWTGAIDPNGYGAFNVGNRKVVKTHRYAYEQVVGRIPDGLHLDHLCRVRECCNPDHLEPVTPRENALRGEAPTVLLWKANRCARGHSMDDAYVAHRSDGRVSRNCKKCQDRNARKRRTNTMTRLGKGDRQRLLNRNPNCAWCGRPMTNNTMHAHHRLERSHGGTWDLSNIIGVHGRCHNVEAKSIHQEPAKAYRLGAMLRSSTMTPDQIPVWDASDHNWWFLDDDGNRTPATEAEAVELIAAAGGYTTKGGRP